MTSCIPDPQALPLWLQGIPVETNLQQDKPLDISLNPRTPHSFPDTPGDFWRPEILSN